MALISKQVSHDCGKNKKQVYLLGIKDGIYYWLEEPSWDCDWYWGFGYIETYTNTRYPAKSNDIESHQHFEGLFMHKQHNIVDEMENFFDDIVLSKSDMYKFANLMKSFYTCKEFAEMCNRGGAHYTTSPCKESLKNPDMEKHVNQVMMPAIFKEIYNLLSPDITKGE